MGCGASSPNDHGGNAPPSPATRVVQHTPPTTRRTRPPTDAKQGTIEQERPAELASKAHPTDGAPARLSPVPNIRSDLHHVFLTHDWGLSDELGRNNHESVAAINEALKQRGLVTWFDAESLQGNILNEMTRGIDNSMAVAVFLTERYIQKVGGTNPGDNCLIEFCYSQRRKPTSLIAVPMEPRCRDPNEWTGAVGAALASNLYTAHFTDKPTSGPQFESNVDLLFERIVGLTRAKLKESPHLAAAVAFAGPVPKAASPAKQGVSLRFLLEFASEHLTGPMAGVTTGDLVEKLIMPQTADKKCRYTMLLKPADVWPSAAGGGPGAVDRPKVYFISHAFRNPFMLVVDALRRRFAGSDPATTFVWLDVFAINQHDTNGDLDSGNMLAETIALSEQTLIVLDEAAVPLSRLWCLYEISETPRERLVPLAHNFSMLQIAQVIRKIDVEKAGCFSDTDKLVIHANIHRKCGSLLALTDRLKALMGDLLGELAELAETGDGAKSSGTRPVGAAAAAPAEAAAVAAGDSGDVDPELAAFAAAIRAREASEAKEALKARRRAELEAQEAALDHRAAERAEGEALAKKELARKKGETEAATLRAAAAAAEAEAAELERGMTVARARAELVEKQAAAEAVRRRAALEEATGEADRAEADARQQAEAAAHKAELVAQKERAAAAAAARARAEAEAAESVARERSATAEQQKAADAARQRAALAAADAERAEAERAEATALARADAARQHAAAEAARQRANAAEAATRQAEAERARAEALAQVEAARQAAVAEDARKRAAAAAAAAAGGGSAAAVEAARLVYTCAEGGDAESLRALLPATDFENPAGVNYVSHPLHVAAYRGNLECVQILVKEAGVSATRMHGDPDVLLMCLQEKVGFSRGRPAAACLIFRALLQWHSFEAERTNLFDRIIHTMGVAIETDTENSAVLAYWLSNTTTLLFLLQRTLRTTGAGAAGAAAARRRNPQALSVMERMKRMVQTSPSDSSSAAEKPKEGVKGVPQVDAKYPALLFKQQLTAFVEKIYSLLRDNVKKEITPQLGSCIQAPHAARAGNVGPGRAESIARGAPGEKALMPLSNHWKPILDVLEKLLKTMRENHVPKFLMQKFFTQVLSFINVQLFNSLLLRRECCSFSNGEYVKTGLSELENWLAVVAGEEWVGSAWDELKYIRQAVTLLVIHQKSKKTLEEITNDLCPVLSIQQLYRISTMYGYDGTETVSQDVLVRMKTSMTEESNASNSNSFLLDDDSNIPFTVEEIASSMEILARHLAPLRHVRIRSERSRSGKAPVCSLRRCGSARLKKSSPLLVRSDLALTRAFIPLYLPPLQDVMEIPLPPQLRDLPSFAFLKEPLQLTAA